MITHPEALLAPTPQDLKNGALLSKGDDLAIVFRSGKDNYGLHYVGIIGSGVFHREDGRGVSGYTQGLSETLERLGWGVIPSDSEVLYTVKEGFDTDEPKTEHVVNGGVFYHEEDQMLITFFCYTVNDFYAVDLKTGLFYDKPSRLGGRSAYTLSDALRRSDFKTVETGMMFSLPNPLRHA